MHEAKTHLSRLLAEVEAGGDVVIGRAGRPIARLVPFTAGRRRRVPGAWEGKGWIADDFDALPDEVAASLGADLL